MATWESFLRRRNLDAHEFIKRNSISTLDQFLSKIEKLGLEVPSSLVLEGLFPKKESKSIDILKDEDQVLDQSENTLDVPENSEIDTAEESSVLEAKMTKKSRTRTKIQKENES